jgi:parallel beta-helix repeat protein
MLLALAALAVVPDRAWGLRLGDAIDIGHHTGEITVEDVRCWVESHDVRHIIVRVAIAEEARGSNRDTSRQQLETLWRAFYVERLDFSVDIYLYVHWPPNVNIDTPVRAQVREAIDILDELSGSPPLPVGRLWIDLEEGPPAGQAADTTVSLIGGALDECGGFPCGIYTSEGWWTSYTASSGDPNPGDGNADFTAYPLWYAHYSCPLDPTFGDWGSISFGGWSAPFGKQYDDYRQRFEACPPEPRFSCTDSAGHVSGRKSYDRNIMYLPPKPDLKVSGIRVAAPPAIGVPTRVLATLSNVGETSSGAFRMKWEHRSPTGATEESYSPPQSLEAGGNVEIPLEWTPGLGSGGAHTFRALADPDGDVRELDETNNSRDFAQTVHYVDLEVRGITFTSPPTVGAPTTAVAQLINVGDVSSGGFNVKWFLDGIQVGYGYHDSLAPGELSYGNVKFNWVASPGTHTLQFVADVDGMISENDERNNAARVRVRAVTPLRNNMVIESDIVAPPGTYRFPDPEEDGALIVGADNVTIDLNGAVLDGGGFQGYGIRNDGHSNVTIKNGTIRGYRAGILVENATANRIERNTLSDNRNRPARNDVGDFLDVWLEWTAMLVADQIGDGVILRATDHTLVDGNTMTGQQSGIGLFDSDSNTITNNDASDNDGWGIHLHRSRDNLIQDNRANNVYDRESTYCRDVQQDGCDTAALLIMKGSHRNRVVRNELRNSGDGFFLGGFHEGANDNVVTANDASAAKHIAFEATYADGNVFTNNTAMGAGRAGFWLGGSTNAVVRGNAITGNRGAGIANEGARDMKIELNVIADNRGGGILVTPLAGQPRSAGYRVDDNQIRNNVGFGIRIEDALQDSVFDGNLVGDNAVGIWVGQVPSLSVAVTSGFFRCTGGCSYSPANLQLEPQSDYYLCAPQCIGNCGACERIVHSETFSGLSATLAASRAEFQFAYSGSTASYHVDLSTVADMSTDVYLDFATGAASPLSTALPQRWDKYTCGRTLYWRVWDQERRVGGPIQAASTFPCSGTFSDLSASLGSSQAQFFFAYSGGTSGYHVDLSTTADMSWDVYLDFATGAASPVTTTDPRRWDKYTCGRTLYWRVWDQSRTVSSPIQARSTFPCTLGTFSRLWASLESSQARFFFTYSGSTSGYHVDLSTTANMSWDVYLDFAAGTASPVITTDPRRWDKYTCGRTLYWRVWDQSRTVSSPIQARSTFSCP